MYKLLSNQIVRLSDNAFIPRDERNRDYQAYLKWVSEGNSPSIDTGYIPSYPTSSGMIVADQSRRRYMEKK